MVIYADILVIINLIVDYFLLLATAKILRKNLSVWRLLLGAAVGGLSSLFIFLPQEPAIANAGFQVLLCGSMVLCVFGFRSVKPFLRASGILILVTCGYGGLMTALWQIAKPNGMIVKNAVVYFNISPTVLLLTSVMAYLIFMAASILFQRTSSLAETCFVTVTAEGKSITMEGIIDTGNSLEDAFGGGEIIIADVSCVESLFGEKTFFNDEKMQARYRMIPCGTVSGSGALDGYRCDRAVVSDGKKNVMLEKPILAVSKTPLHDTYTAIVNPKVFL